MEAHEAFASLDDALRRYGFDIAAGSLETYHPVLVREDGGYLATVFPVGDDWHWVVWREGQALAGRRTPQGTPEAACDEAVRAVALRKAHGWE